MSNQPLPGQTSSSQPLPGQTSSSQVLPGQAFSSQSLLGVLDAMSDPSQIMTHHNAAAADDGSAIDRLIQMCLQQPAPLPEHFQLQPLQQQPNQLPGQPGQSQPPQEWLPDASWMTSGSSMPEGIFDAPDSSVRGMDLTHTRMVGNSQALDLQGPQLQGVNHIGNSFQGVPSAGFGSLLGPPSGSTIVTRQPPNATTAPASTSAAAVGSSAGAAVGSSAAPAKGSRGGRGGSRGRKRQSDASSARRSSTGGNQLNLVAYHSDECANWLYVS